MSNLPVNLETLNVNDLLALTGQAVVRETYSGFPRLTVNKLGEDDQGRQIPTGTFCVSQNGKAAYGKPVLFRPYINAYQYSVYDEAANKYTNKSIIFKSFNEEALDEQGGIACGKIPAKKREGLTEAQLLAQKKIKCYRNVYGQVTFDGVTADGDKVSITELPVLLRLSGDNFMPIQEVFDALSAKRLSMLSYNLVLSTERKKTGTNVYYRVAIKPDLEHQLKLTQDNWDTFKLFQEAIDKENKEVIEKHRSVAKARVSEAAAADVVATLENDFHDDDISDV